MKNFFNNFINKRNIHLDFAATTPVDALVYKSMKPYLTNEFFNPSSNYLEAQKIKKEIAHNRGQIADIFQVKDNEVIFTQGGTESANMAIIGLAQNVLRTQNFVPHMIFVDIEHPAVRECIPVIQKLGVEVDIVSVDENGMVNIKELESLLRPETVLVSVIYVSSELGVVQSLNKISRIIKRFKNDTHRAFNQFPFLYTDASQAVTTQGLTLSVIGVDMMTIDGSKIFAPKMSGLLIKKQYVEIDPIIHGGGHESGLRSGTENPATIVALKTALELVQKRKPENIIYFDMLKKYFIQQLDSFSIPYELNGDIQNSVPIINICIKGLNSDFAVIQMDEFGVNCASATACANIKGIPFSQSVESLGKKDCASSSLRFSFSHTTTRSEIKKALQILKKVCHKQKVV